MKKNILYRFFNSRVLAIILIITLGVLAFLGTIIPQEDIFTREEIQDHDSRRVISRYLDNVLSLLEISGKDPWRSSIYAVYHSWWFVLTIILLALNLVVCSYDKLLSLRHIYDKFKYTGSPGDLEKHSNSAKLSVKKPVKDPEKLIGDWGRKLFRINEVISLSKDSSVFRFQKHRFSRFGYILVHIGLLLVMAGAMISSFTREKGFIWLMDGQEKDSYYSYTQEKSVPLGYNLRAENLKMELYENGMSVKDWYSTLIISRNGEELARKQIEVNHPLEFEGRRFYQANWKDGVPDITLIVIETATGIEKKFTIELDENMRDRKGSEQTYNAFNEKLFFRVSGFYPDFRIGGGQFYSETMDLVNPAVVLQVYWSGMQEAKRKIIFSRFPEMNFSMMHEKTGKEEPYRFVLAPDIKLSSITGIEIGEDSGTNTVYAGFFLVIVGIIIGFYFNHRQYWISLEEDKKGLHIVAAGTSARHRYQFSREFENRCTDLKQYLLSMANLKSSEISLSIKKNE